MLTERIGRALALAVEAHDGQKRKGTDIPYLAHPMGVASIALDHGADEDQAIAALLHDAVEDAAGSRCTDGPNTINVFMKDDRFLAETAVSCGAQPPLF